MDGAHDGRGHQAVDRAPVGEPVPQVGRRDVEARDRRPARPSSPRPGGSACASPARSTTTTVARSRVSSSRRQVGMLATASAPRTRNSSRSGADSASSVSAVTDGLAALDLDRRRLDAVEPSTAASTSARRSAARRHDAAALLPRVAGDDEQHPVEPELRRASRPRPRRARRGRDRTCRRTRRAARLRHRRESTGVSCLHPGETLASSAPRSIVVVSDASESATHVLVRVWLPDRPGALGLVASRIGAVDGDIVGIDVLERGDDVAVDEFAVVLARRRSRSTSSCARSRRSTARASRRCAPSTHFPDPRLDALESATALCAADSVDGLHAHARRADPGRVPRRLERAAAPTRTRARVGGRRHARRVGARGARGRHRGVADASPTAPPGPTTSRSRRSPTTTPRCSSGATGTRSGGASARSCSRSPGIADRTWALLN